MAKQYLVSRVDEIGRRFEIVGQEARHIARVLRKKDGDLIHLFDGNGNQWIGKIEISNSDSVCGKLVEEIQPSTLRLPDAFEIHLYQALPKGKKWEWILEHASEIGATTFTPLITARTIARIEEGDISKKLARWQKILEGASKQCGRPNLPSVFPPFYFKEAFERLENNHLGSDELVLFCDESKAVAPLAQALSALRNKDVNLVSKIHIFIGPEGGWTAEEISFAKSQGAIPVNLGPYVLKAETAPIVAIAMLQAFFREHLT